MLGVAKGHAICLATAESDICSVCVCGSVCVLTSSYVRLATECIALLQNLTSNMLASSSISQITEKARWSESGEDEGEEECWGWWRGYKVEWRGGWQGSGGIGGVSTAQ